MQAASELEAPARDARGRVKCVVWDLDHTVWDGILLEDPDVRLRPGVVDILRALDGRGILLSIASRNDHDAAMARLAAFGLDEYFLHPQIGWGSKATAIARIAGDLNLGVDAFAFVDDQPFERDEVRFSHPQVLCLDPAELPAALARAELNPRFVTDDSRRRRSMYRGDVRRRADEDEFAGSKQAFLASLGLRFRIAPAGEDDLRRAEELTVRTHQLNTTGYTYSYEELDALRRSPDHLLLVASLDDRYGSYGTIGLVLVECGPRTWTIKLLLMSCRVMSRGVGTVLLHHVMERARGAGVALRAEFVPNDRNRMMLVTYRFAGFALVEECGTCLVLENDLARIAPSPEHVVVEVAA